MTMTERSRNVLYRRLTETVRDEQAVQELMSHFPATEGEAPASEALVRTEIAGVRTEIADVRTEIAELRTELRTGLAELRTEVHQLMQTQLRWVVGTMVAMSSIQMAFLGIVLG